MRVLRVERDTVVGMEHDGKVTELNASRIPYKEAEAPCYGIVSYTFYRDVQRVVSALALDLKAFIRQCSIKTVLRNHADEAHGKSC